MLDVVASSQFLLLNVYITAETLLSKLFCDSHKFFCSKCKISQVKEIFHEQTHQKFLMDSENTALRNLSETLDQNFIKVYIKFDKCQKLKKFTKSTSSNCFSRRRQGTFDIPAEHFLLNSGKSLSENQNE